MSKTFTARELIDRLHEINERMFEEVLDMISDSYVGMSCCWEDDEDGNMILLTHEEYDAQYNDDNEVSE